MWTSDLFTVTSPSQLQKHHICESSADESLSPRSECSSRSESPLPMDPISPASPRSIFKSYWLSPKGIDEEEELSRKLSSLQMPLVTANDDESSIIAIDEEHEPSTKDDLNEAPNKICLSSDDTAISYKIPPAPERPSRRRQILPNPPQSPVPPKPTCLRSCCRPWSSTSALIRKPSGSCLRPSRYSFSGSPSAAASLDDVTKIQESTAHSHHKKEVSFYAQVSVFEFTVPQEQRSDGWSKYFV